MMNNWKRKSPESPVYSLPLKTPPNVCIIRSGVQSLTWEGSLHDVTKGHLPRRTVLATPEVNCELLSSGFETQNCHRKTAAKPGFGTNDLRNPILGDSHCWSWGAWQSWALSPWRSYRWCPCRIRPGCEWFAPGAPTAGLSGCRRRRFPARPPGSHEQILFRPSLQLYPQMFCFFFFLKPENITCWNWPPKWRSWPIPMR